EDQSVLPAAGDTGGPRNTGGQFASFTIQDLLSSTPLDLLDGEGTFGAFTTAENQPFLDDAVILPTAGEFTLVLDDEGLPGGNFGDATVGDDVDPDDVDSAPEHIGSGTLPHSFG